MSTELLTFYDTYKKKVSAYGYVMASIHFDQATIAPKAGLGFANEMQGVLEADYFSYLVDPENIKKIEALFGETTDEQLKKEIRLRLRDLHQISLIPKEVYLDFQKSVLESQQCWEKAKQTNDYPLFKPHLISLLEKRKKMLTYLSYEGSDYDYLLDQFQMGMNAEKYDAFFAEIKDKLVPLIHKVRKAKRKIDTSPLEKTYCVEGQKKFTQVMKGALKIDPEKCYIAESVHPFCMPYSANDTRFTTKYLPENVMSAALSTAHEYGHALYNLQINPEFEMSTFASEVGFAMHESQSRLVENHIGRSLSFWKAHYSKLQQIFPEQLSQVSLEEFVDMINVSTSGLIRIEADELTYPLHILIRYELEKEIFNGTVDYDKLDQLWADKYEEYLGVRPGTASEGILQDVHWSAAYHGYFPSYALGSAFAAQIYQQLEKEMNVAEILENDQFDKIAAWLGEKVHQHGASKTYDEILLDVTGERFNPSYYTDYLVKKYTELYQL